MKTSHALILFSAFTLIASCATSPKPVVEDPRIGTLTQQVSALRTEIVDLKNLVALRDLSITDLDLINAQLKTTADKLTVSQEQVSLLQTQLADKADLIAKLGAGDSKLQAMLETNAQLQAKVADLASQLASANQSIKDLLGRNLAAEAKLALMVVSFDQSAKRIVSLEASVSALKSQIGERDSTIALLRGQIDMAGKANADLNAH